MKVRRFLLLVFASFLLGANVSQAQSECELNYSLYREYFKQWKSAKYNKENINPQMISSWRYVFNNCPDFKQTTYVEGVSIITNAFIRYEKDPVVRDKYIDTLIMVYDKRAEYFGAGQIGNIMGRKGSDILRLNENRYEEAYHALKQAIDTDGNNNESNFVQSYFRTVISMAKAGKIEESAILDEYGRLSEIVDFNIKKYTEEANQKEFDNFMAVKNYLESAVQPFANCEDLVRIYQAKFDANPDDVELLNKIAQTLDKRGCDDSELYLAVAVKLHDIDPSPESAYLIGKKYLNNKEYNQAKEYLIEATKTENADWAYQSNIYLAQIMNMNKSYEQSRAYAKKAAEIDKTKGEPYIIIGQSYAASAESCGTGPVHSKAAYWAAVDKFEKAKSIDSSVTQRVNELVNSYVYHFPTSEDLFMHGLYEGDEYILDKCWINETTKVRAAKTE